MSAIRFLLAISIIPWLSNCGLNTPEFQEFPGDKVDGQQLVQSIAYNVHCEVRDAIDAIYNDPYQPRDSTFLDSWGVQIALSLQVEEKGSISPSVNWLPPSPASAIFNLAGGVNAAAGSTRQDKMNSYFTVGQLRALKRCRPGSRPGGVLLMQADLGLEEWLRSNVIAWDRKMIDYTTDYSDGPLKTNVIQHEVKFEISNGGNLTTGWKLSRVSVNQSGELFSASRDRTNDLIITLGPTVATPKAILASDGKPKLDRQGRAMYSRVYRPSEEASSAALSSQIGLAVANATKSLNPR